MARAIVSGINERPSHSALLRRCKHPVVFLRPVPGLSSQGFGPRVPLRSTHGLRSGAASRLNGSIGWQCPIFARAHFCRGLLRANLDLRALG